MHIYGDRAHFAYLGLPLGEQFLCIFTVGAAIGLVLGRLEEAVFMYELCNVRSAM